MKYIIEICVAIDLAILGIAYPILINEINKIGERYNSNYLSELFKEEVPQRQIKLPKWVSKISPKYLNTTSRFKFYLLLTIFSFTFLILDCKPLFGMNFWLINNSAELIVLSFTVVLLFNFFIWIDKVALYNGKTKEILKHTIEKYHNSESNSGVSKYCLKTINEFTSYAIRNQDSHIQFELLEFYQQQFNRERQMWIDSIEEKKIKPKIRAKIKTEGVVYSSELYDLIYKINLEISRTENIFIKAIEHQAISGWWLYGKGHEQITISSRTYQLVWNILKKFYR